MSDRSEHGLPQELAELGERLRENRTRPSALELDQIKLQAKTRAHRRSGSPWQLRRGVNVRSRGVTAILTLLLIGGTTAGGIAGGEHDSGGGSSSGAQYQPPKCTKDMRKCECPKGYSLGVVNNQITCIKNAEPPPPPCDDRHGHGHGHGDDCDDDHGDDHGHGGHGHHHHNNWHQGHNGHWQWCDNGRDWHDWSGRDDDW
jgi:hypothetical protein